LETCELRDKRKTMQERKKATAKKVLAGRRSIASADELQ
jgi:hypothetical protein